MPSQHPRSSRPVARASIVSGPGPERAGVFRGGDLRAGGLRAAGRFAFPFGDEDVPDRFDRDRAVRVGVRVAMPEGYPSVT